MSKRIVYPSVAPKAPFGQSMSTTPGIYNAPAASTGSSNTLGVGTLILVPWYIPKRIRIDRIGLEVTIVGDVGSTIRLGIYKDTGNYYPGELLLDAGSILGDSVSVQEITIDTVLENGDYWIGAVVQNVTVTQPTVRVTSSPVVTVPHPSAAGASASTASGLRQLNVTGALPANFSDIVLVQNPSPRVFIRVA